MKRQGATATDLAGEVSPFGRTDRDSFPSGCAWQFQSSDRLLRERAHQLSAGESREAQLRRPTTANNRNAGHWIDLVNKIDRGQYITTFLPPECDVIPFGLTSCIKVDQQD